MSEEQLAEARQEAETKAQEMLQMPPALRVRSTETKILMEDPALKGLETSRLVFTDITFGVKNSERLVVVREPDGTLREADWDLKDRMNQVYFPNVGRQIKTPQMFEESLLKRLLDNGQYEYILDRACIQFEPNNALYQKITSITYQHINDNKAFEKLRSTRHFGPLVFFLTWFKIPDNLILELVETSHIEDASLLVKLYCKIHNVEIASENSSKIVEEFVTKYSTKKAPLELALQSFKEAQKQKEELEQGIKSAHGL